MTKYLLGIGVVILLAIVIKQKRDTDLLWIELNTLKRQLNPLDFKEMLYDDTLENQGSARSAERIL